MTRRSVVNVVIGLFALLVLSGDGAQAAGRFAALRAARVAAIESAAPVSTAQYAMPPAGAVAPTQPGMVMAPGTAAGCCCPAPCISYRHRGHHRVCCDCAPSYETVLLPTNSNTCCPVAVPVCLPGCCQGEPSVSCHSGLLHSVVRYDWCCGYSVTVRFKHNGDVVVVSRG
jgi:hypothetical protein